MVCFLPENGGSQAVYTNSKPYNYLLGTRAKKGTGYGSFNSSPGEKPRHDTARAEPTKPAKEVSRRNSKPKRDNSGERDVSSYVFPAH
jgi:hypothetical protein